MIIDRAKAGMKIEAELYRNGKLVPDDPKPTIKAFISGGASGITFVELIKKEKEHDTDNQTEP